MIWRAKTRIQPKAVGFARDSARRQVQNRKMQYWMVKQEPETYSWDRFVKDGRTSWTGVRNFSARNNLRGMSLDDPVFYYHSVTGKEVVGLAKVARIAYPDPTAEEGDWSCIDLQPDRPLRRPVTLAEMKADPALKDMPLFKQSRLSVVPLTKAQFDRVLKLSETKP